MLAAVLVAETPLTAAAAPETPNTICFSLDKTPINDTIGDINAPSCVKSNCVVTHVLTNPGARLYKLAHIFANHAKVSPTLTTMSSKFWII